MVLGISPDKPSAQKKFQQKYDFPFSLLSDEDKAVAKNFGVLKETRNDPWRKKGLCQSDSSEVSRQARRGQSADLSVRSHVALAGRTLVNPERTYPVIFPP